MTDRDAHRAAVEAGYASLAEYIEKWGENKMDILERLSEYNPPDRVNDEMREIAIDIQDAKNEIERLREALKGYRDAVIIDATMEGQRFMGCNRSALRRAWEKDCAALQQKDSE